MAAKQIRKRRQRQVLVAVVAAVVLVGFVALATLVQGRVSGTEFSPDTFQQRSFTFWEIPLVHLQISPIRRSGSVNSLTNYLKAKNLITSNSKQPTWHLVELSRGAVSASPGDAEILVGYLDANGGGTTTWRTWSNDHPKRAAVLWPRVQQLAKRELYLLMPDLFEIARQAESPEQLRQQLDRYVVAQYAEMIADLIEAEQIDIAEGLLEEALEQAPEDPRLQELRQRLPAADATGS